MRQKRTITGYAPKTRRAYEENKNGGRYVAARHSKWRPTPYSKQLFDHMFNKWRLKS